MRTSLAPDQVVTTLRAHEPALRAAGIVRLTLHGSVARSEATPLSDVDLIAEFDPARRISLIGRANLENRLTDILGVRADLADRKVLRPEVLEKVQIESVLVF